MRVFFYHTENIRYIYSRWRRGDFPGHLLYGATHLREHGIDITPYRHATNGSSSRLIWNIRTAWQLLTCHKHIDAVYATRYKGIELIIFWRALRIYSKPVIIWQHQPITRPKSTLRRMVARLFYRGIDSMIFFSEKMLNDSASTFMLPQRRMHVVPWGADLDFYDHVMRDNPCETRHGFISTGKERRDFRTLIEAFCTVNEKSKKHLIQNKQSPDVIVSGAKQSIIYERRNFLPGLLRSARNDELEQSDNSFAGMSARQLELNIYLTRSNLGMDYEKLINGMPVDENIKLFFTNGLIPQKLSVLVNQAACVVICCEKTNYTVGLTTLVEALALGLPVICSRNPQMPMDIEREGCGITVPYHDVDGWVAAINHIASHPDDAAEMGRRGRALAERLFNDKQCASDVARLIKSMA